MQESEASWQVSVRLRSIRWLLLAAVVEETAPQSPTRGQSQFQSQPAARAARQSRRRRVDRHRRERRTDACRADAAGGRRIGSDAEGTAAEEALRVVEEAQAREAIRRVREIDPSWKPSDSLTDPNSAAGPIERARGQRQEAEDRLIELAKQPADSLIDAYRRQQGLDLFGEPNWSRAENSVALCKVGAKPFIGVNLRR